MHRAALTLLIASLLSAPTLARAEDPSEHPPEPAPETETSRDSGHRFMVDIAPYTAWSWYYGNVEAYSGVRDKEDLYRGAVGIALHWEYDPIPYLGIGVKVDIELPVDKPSFLNVRPTLALRGILPLLQDRLELFILAQLGAVYLQYGDGYVGYGYVVSADVGVGYKITRRWGVHLHGGFRFFETWMGDDDLAGPLGAQAAFGIFYLL